jgi:hypothetical protein
MLVTRFFQGLALAALTTLSLPCDTESRVDADLPDY